MRTIQYFKPIHSESTVYSYYNESFVDNKMEITNNESYDLFPVLQTPSNYSIKCSIIARSELCVNICFTSEVIFAAQTLNNWSDTTFVNVTEGAYCIILYFALGNISETLYHSRRIKLKAHQIINSIKRTNKILSI